MAISFGGITVTHMQDFASLGYQDWHKVVDNMPEHEPYTLTDNRDDNTYTIAKLKDGLVWMCQNLRLGGDKEIVLTPEDSDVMSNFTLPTNNPSGFTVNNNNANAAFVDSTYDGYYSWYTATAGTGTSSTNNGDATSSICPKGWRLPTKDEFVTMAGKYGSSSDYTAWSSALRATPVPGFVLSGFYSYSSPSGQGSYGYYWSSTTDSTNYACSLILNGSYVNPPNSNNKYIGFSVRGILREPEKPPLPLSQIFNSNSSKPYTKLFLPQDGEVMPIKEIYGNVNGEVKLVHKQYGSA